MILAWGVASVTALMYAELRSIVTASSSAQRAAPSCLKNDSRIAALLPSEAHTTSLRSWLTTTSDVLVMAAVAELVDTDDAQAIEAVRISPRATREAPDNLSHRGPRDAHLLDDGRLVGALGEVGGVPHEGEARARLRPGDVFDFDAAARAGDPSEGVAKPAPDTGEVEVPPGPRPLVVAGASAPAIAAASDPARSVGHRR